ncbi:hypothetical protein TWF225_005099 [Orbilia oligospora]|uniref:Uncharacterized protein n=1 Tax=Orbilia oligospora TaxID=2813651 RepID=A0A8H2DRP2_ORBOL|nr:hypothetical protein TWF225_005099 [Orbilia oligospora]KAF3251558.1 hypothetical protein TWF128_007224 [Orbilia oligospora]KAF3256862.1 hypothetical protein TWF217_006181 [Orbilia oligospora]TGJ64399.1 hypothetical protein EYR41_010458 [Orbilia oligospora]
MPVILKVYALKGYSFYHRNQVFGMFAGQEANRHPANFLIDHVCLKAPDGLTRDERNGHLFLWSYEPCLLF